MRRDPTAVSAFGRLMALVGGAVFVASLLFAVYRYIEFGTPPWHRPAWSWVAYVVPIGADVTLFTLFAIHHSVFARAGWKARIAAVVAPQLERSVYVWISSLLFIGVMAAWQPVPGIVWSIEPPISLAFVSLQIAGVVLSVRGAARLDVLDLAGVKQAFGVEPGRPGLVDNGLYRLVRHPIYLGWLLAVWPAAMMSGSRFIFAATSSLYLFLAMPIEERDLRRTFGAAYDDYARRVRWRIVPFVY